MSKLQRKSQAGTPSLATSEASYLHDHGSNQANAAALSQAGTPAAGGELGTFLSEASSAVSPTAAMSGDSSSSTTPTGGTTITTSRTIRAVSSSSSSSNSSASTGSAQSSTGSAQSSTGSAQSSTGSAQSSTGSQQAQGQGQAGQIPDLEVLLQTLTAQSSALNKAFTDARAAGWVIEYGSPGGGTYADRNAAIPRIAIDPSHAQNMPWLVSSLAHELGHAVDEAPEHHYHRKMKRQEYVDANTREFLNGEAEATIMELQVRDDLMKGPNPIALRVAGATASDKIRLWGEYKSGKLTREQLVYELGNLFAKGERPSTNPNITYDQYYAQVYEDWWDTNIKR